MVQDDSPVDIKTVQHFELLVYPNPSENSFNFILESPDNTGIDMIIYDISGKMLTNKKDLKPNMEINFGRELSARIYFVVLEQGQHRETRKIIKY